MNKENELKIKDQFLFKGVMMAKCKKYYESGVKLREGELISNKPIDLNEFIEGSKGRKAMIFKRK